MRRASRILAGGLGAVIAAITGVAWLLNIVSSWAAEPPRGIDLGGSVPSESLGSSLLPENTPARALGRSGEDPTRHRHWSRRRLVALAAAGVVALVAVGAYAFWTVSASAPSAGGSLAASVNAGNTPSAASTANGREVTVSWGASTLSNGHAVDGYLVQRYPSGGGLPDINPFSTCAGTVAALTCTEAAVPPGSWKYTITPVIGANWQGPESPLSGTVTVGPETFSVDGSPFGAAAFSSGVTHATGAITGFAKAEGVTYKVDSTTTITGSPASVANDGSASVTNLQIPSSSGEGGHTVNAVGDASYFPSSASAAVVIDTVSPTVSASLSPAANGAGWNNATPVQVTLSETDPAPSAGAGAIKYTTDGSDPTSSLTAVTYSGPFNISSQGTTTVKFFGMDAVGNSSSTVTQSVKIDTVAPTNGFSLTNKSGGGSLLSGTTLYYQGSTAGSFKLSNALTDPLSGPASTGYAVLSGSSGTFTFASSSVTSGPPYVSNAFSWSSGETSAPTETATGFDVASNSSAAVFTLTNDSTAPSGGALTVNGTAATGGGTSSYNSTGGFSIGTRTDYTDAGSGLASSTLTRQSATLSSSDGIVAGVCGSFGSATPIAGKPTQNGMSNGCYLYTLTGIDNVGNTISISTIVKVDTTAPALPTLAFSNVSGQTFINGTTVYVNPQGSNSGSFTVTASPTDNDSGILKVSFPALGTGFSGGGADVTSSPYSAAYSWNSTAGTPGAQTVTAYDNANLTTTGGFTVSQDKNPPTGGALTVNGTAATGGGSTSYNNAGTYTISAITDYTDSGSGLASSTLVRDQATLSSSNGIVDGTCGTFGSASTVSSRSTPITQTLTGPTCYRYTLTGVDNVGNTAAVSTIVKVDTTGPSAPLATASAATGNTFINGSTVFTNPQAGKSGGFTISATATDNDSGISKVTFPALTGYSGGGGNVITSPYTTTYSWSGAGATASGAQTVTSFNNANLSTATAGAFTVTPDTTNPTSGALTVDGTAAATGGTTSYSSSGSFSINSITDYTDAGSGLAFSTLVRDQATLSSSNGIANGTCGTFGSATTISSRATPIAQTLTGPTCYRYTLTGIDNVGNTASISTIVKVDTTASSAPTPTLSAATGNTFISGTTAYINPQSGRSGGFTVMSSPTDPDSGIQNVVFPALTGFSSGGGSVSSSPFTTTYAWSSAVGASGSQTITATNNATLTNTDSFTVTPDTAAPTGGALTVNGTAATGGGTSSYSTSTSYTLSRTDYADAGSGLATSTLTRETATLSSSDGVAGGTCGTFGSLVTLSGTSIGTGIATANCYRYMLTGTDNVGNATSIVTIVKVDTTASSTPTPTLSAATGNTFVSGTTAFINAQTGKSGGFTVTSSPTDAQSGIQNVVFPALTGFSSGGGTVSSSPFTTTYAWSGAVGASGSQTITATNNATLTNIAGFTVTPDTAAPTGGAVSVNGTAATGGSTSSVNNSNSIAINSRTDYSDGGSGLASSVLTVQSETLTGSTCGALGSGGPFTSATTISGTTQPAGITAGFCYVYTLTGTDNVGNVASITTTVVDNSVSFTVTAQPTTVTAGVATSGTAVKITAIKNGATDTSYSGTLAWSGANNSPSGATPILPTSPTWTSGVATFGITLVKAETETLSATDGTRTANFAAITVNAAPASKIAFVNCSIPSNNTTCSGQPIAMGNNGDMTFNIQAQDSLGNPSAPTASFTITFTNSDGTFSITSGSPASITTSSATSGQVNLHHAQNGGTDTLTATPSNGFAAITLTAKK